MAHIKNKCAIPNTLPKDFVPNRKEHIMLRVVGTPPIAKPLRLQAIISPAVTGQLKNSVIEEIAKVAIIH